MRCRTPAALGLWLVLAAAARADIPPPGHKPAYSTARFENLADYPDYVFFAAHHPDRDFRYSGNEKSNSFAVDVQRLDASSPETGLNRNPINGPLYLLAVPKPLLEKSGGKVMSHWFNDKDVGMLQASIPGGYRSAPESANRREFRYVYRVHIAGDTSTKEKHLTLARQDSPDGDSDRESPAGLPSPGSSRWYIIAGFAAAALVVALGWLFLRRRGANEI